MKTISSYFESIGKFSRMEKCDEDKLFKIYNKTKDITIRNKIIENNLVLVVCIANKFKNRGVDLLDLIQEGNIGLIKAIDKFTPNKTCKFSSYATWWIKVYIANKIDDKIVKVPDYINRKIKNKTLPDLSIISLAMPISNELGNETTLENTLESLTNNPNEEIEIESRNDRFNEIFETLTRKEKIILKMRYGLKNRNITKLESIGKRLNLTKERVRQIEVSAINKLKILAIEE